MPTNDILTSPEKFGFEWRLESLEKDGVTYDGVPVMWVTDYDLFKAAFPGLILSCLNGQSVHVNSQRIGRDARHKGIEGKSVSQINEEIKSRNVRWAQGVRSPAFTRTVEVYIGPKGERFSDKASAENAWLEHFTASAAQ